MGVSKEGEKRKGPGRPPGTSDPDQDLKIAIGRGMGLTLEQTAEFAKCGMKKVQYKLKEPESIKIMQFVNDCKTRKEHIDNTISKDQYQDGLEELLADCRTLLKRALKSEDVGIALRAVKQIEDRIFGAPTQRMESKSVSAHVKVVQIPDHAIAAFLKTADDLNRITSGPSALPAPEDSPYIDAEEAETL